MNYYNIVINGMRGINNEIISVYPVDESKNDIVFGKHLGCFILSEVWFQL